MPWFANTGAGDDDQTDPAVEAASVPLFDGADASSDLTEPIEVSHPADDPQGRGPLRLRLPPAEGARPTRRLSGLLPDREVAEARPPSAPIPTPLRPWLPIRTFLLGMLCGALAVVLVALLVLGSMGSDRSPLPLASTSSPVSSSGSDLVLQLSPAYLTALVNQHLPQSGLPGQISHLRITTQPGALIEIRGEETLTILGVALTRPFLLQVQPLTSACHLEVHLLHADLGGLPVTGLVALFEGRLNEQLAQQPTPTGLPSAFLYCAQATWTTTSGLLVSYSAQPTALHWAGPASEKGLGEGQPQLAPTRARVEIGRPGA